MLMSPLPSFAVTIVDIHRGAGMYQTFWRTQIRTWRPNTPFTWRQYSPTNLWKSRVTCYSESSSSPDIRGHHHSLRQASNWAFNTALAFAVPPGLNTIAWKTYFIFDLFTLPPSFKSISWLKNNRSEVEEIFSQGHTFTAWKIGKNADKKTLKEVEKSKNFPATLFLF